MLRFKDTARLDPRSPAMRHLLCTLADLSERDGVDYVVTSANDSGHAPGSPHFTNEALDIRTKVFSGAYKHGLRERLEEALGPAFRVLLEHEGLDQEHLHAQVRRGVRYVGDGTD